MGLLDSYAISSPVAGVSVTVGVGVFVGVCTGAVTTSSVVFFAKSAFASNLQVWARVK